VAGRRERRELTCVHLASLTLAHGALVRLEPEPRKVFEQRSIVLGAGTPAVVVLDPKQYPPAERPGESPDEHGVHRVAEVQVAGRRGGKARERRRRKASAQVFENGVGHA
jgi:hypothetical protein